jgi:hypothetical protein
MNVPPHDWSHYGEEWSAWFAWFPVRLLTWEWAWLRTIKRRPAVSGEWSYGKWDYAN